MDKRHIKNIYKYFLFYLILITSLESVSFAGYKDDCEAQGGRPYADNTKCYCGILRRDFDPNTKNCPKMEGVLQSLDSSNQSSIEPQLTFIEIEKAVEAAELGNEIERIQTFGHIMTPQQFVETFHANREPGYILGLTQNKGIYDVFSKIGNLEQWMPAYRKLGIEWGETITGHTDRFLTAITSERNPIVFLVPNKALDKTIGKVTVDELEWFLNHPDRMSNVYFVFGAYDIISDFNYVLLSHKIFQNFRWADPTKIDNSLGRMLYPHYSIDSK